MLGLVLAEPAGGDEQTAGKLVEWMETLLVYKLPRLSREEIRIMLDIFNVDLKQTRFYQEVCAEGVAEGREEGREEGQRQERPQIAHGLLERVEDDRLLAEKTGLREAEIARLRGERR